MGHVTKSSNNSALQGHKREYHNNGEGDGTTQQTKISQQQVTGLFAPEQTCKLVLRVLSKKSINTGERTRMVRRHIMAQLADVTAIEPAKANLKASLYAKQVNVDEAQTTVAALRAHLSSKETADLGSRSQIVVGLDNGSRSGRLNLHFGKLICRDPLRKLWQLMVMLCMFINPTVAVAIPNATNVNESPGWPVGPGWPPFEGWPILVFAASTILLACWLARTFTRSPVAGIGMGVCAFIAIYICGDENTTATVFWT